ncbi:hypothetical protein PINS_up013585 [Pythium insidiosum]|nr:hypothetical protein PINS_up013585 [Pythium insidiosum]
MSYDFYSLVSSIKDKSSQAMATLSSDLKEFTTIMQEDVAEVAKNVRKTVHEKSEALRQRSDQQAEHATLSDEEEKKEEEEGEGGHDEKDLKDANATNAETNAGAMGLPSIPGINNMFSFSNLSLESVGSKLLHTADELLGTLAGSAHLDEDIEPVSFESQTEEEKLETARRYRLLALQEDSETYLEAPMDTETFAKWRESVSKDEFTSIQQEVLAHYPTVATKLGELVPASVSADDFWAHYIYKASLLAAQEQRGADLLEHALNDNEEEVGWDVESPRQDLGDQEFEEDKAEAAAEVAAKSPSTTRHGATSPVDSESGPSNASSDGDSSWIELDEQRREAAASVQAPLSSSSSTASSFVPLDGGAAAAVAPSTAPVDEIEDEDEALDWGDDDEKDDKQHTANANTNTNADADVDATPDEASARKGGDWGEWD